MRTLFRRFVVIAGALALALVSPLARAVVEDLTPGYDSSSVGYSFKLTDPLSTCTQSNGGVPCSLGRWSAVLHTVEGSQYPNGWGYLRLIGESPEELDDSLNGGTQYARIGPCNELYWVVTGQEVGWETLDPHTRVSLGCPYRSDPWDANSPISHRVYDLYCPEGTTVSGDYRSCLCPPDRMVYKNICTRYLSKDRTKKKPEQCFGNPIHPLTGTKRETVDTRLAIGGLPLVLTYDTSRKAHTDAVVDDVTAAVKPKLTFVRSYDPPALGPLWFSSLHRQLGFDTNRAATHASRGDGRLVSFLGTSPDADVTDRLTIQAGSKFLYYDHDAGSVEEYELQGGRLTAITPRSGGRLNFTYSTTDTPSRIAPAPGYLSEVSDGFGRSIRFEYELPQGAVAAIGGRISRIIDSAGMAIALAYDAPGKLSRLTWADGKSRVFHYEDPALPWALTGVSDELGVRYATFAYDPQGRARLSEHSGGVGRVEASYASAPTFMAQDSYDVSTNTLTRTYAWALPEGLSVSTATGATIGLGATLVQGAPKLTSQSQPAGSGCDAATSRTAYDANGNVLSRDDFTGKRTCYANDFSRNLETARVEGLADTASCSVLTAAKLPVGSRKTSTQWHPDWRLITQRSEPGRITTRVYNGQPDPFAANATASCAPPSALLPDGKPIVVLCREVEQATTDPDGSKGFGARLESGVATREHKWTYDEHGRVLTHDGPRTDVVDITAYAYASGDLARVTDAIGRAVQYTRYDPHGNVLEVVDANGTIWSYTYDARQRLTGITGAGETTAYGYDNAGQLTRITLPDGSYVGYAYDDAHRQIAVFDDRGNRIDYALDNAGQRVGEQVRDPGGALRRRLERGFDALTRMQQLTGRD